MTLEMSAPISTVIPARIKAGATLIFQLSLPDYSAADGWVINFKGQNKDNTFEFSSTASGSNHLINVTAAVTAGWLAGDYLLEAEVVKAAETYPVADLWITVDANLSGPDTGDPRSTSQIALDNALASLARLTGTTINESDVEGTRIRRKMTEDAIAGVRFWENEVRKEKILKDQAAGKNSGRNRYTHFTSIR